MLFVKRWHIIVITFIAVVAALAAGGSAFYKYYIVPKYLSPIIEEVKDRIQEPDIVESLYSGAVRLHDEGILEDESFTSFVRAYKDFNKNDEKVARQVLEQKEESDISTGNDSNTVMARYASSKVGVEMIQINDGEAVGKAETRYSTERTSDRIKAEDVISAEKIIAEKEQDNLPGDIENKPEDDEEAEKKAQAYAKLKESMTADEFAAFLSIMSKLDENTLKGYINDKEGLKQYLHSRLSDSEYSQIVNLGYKYAGVLLNDQ